MKVSNNYYSSFNFSGIIFSNKGLSDSSELETHKNVFLIAGKYLKPTIKQKLFILRNKKQADFLAQSFSLRKSKLTLREKVGFIKSILNIDSSPSRLIRLFRS